MSAEGILNTPSWLTVFVVTLFSPVVLLVALFYSIFRMIFCNKHCKSIDNEIALVTGGAHGLGKAIAIELAQSGCHVAVVDINLEGAKETANILRAKYNVKAKAYKVDVTKYEQVVELNDKITEDLGAVSILVNNAGMVIFSNLAEPDNNEVQRMIDVNLTAHFWAIRVFLPNMKRQNKGHIVATCSLSALFPLVFNAEYTSTKFAVRGLMSVLRQDLKVCNFDNIFTTTVYPTFLRTNVVVEDLTEKLDMSKLLPILTGERAARSIVRGMRQNKAEVHLPEYLGLLYKLFQILSLSWRDKLMIMPTGLLNKYQEIRSKKNN